MSRISRIVVPHFPHHVTQRSIGSATVFHDDCDRLAYLEFIAQETARFGVEVLAWCLMHNHVHFVVVPEEQHSLARAFGEGHRRFTRRRNSLRGMSGLLFQGRFASSVLDEAHLRAAVRHVELHPVRSQLVEHPCDYPWSSARFHADATVSDPLVKDRTLRGLVEQWDDFLSREDAAAVTLIRQTTRTGRPAGDAQFLSRIASLTGRNLGKGTPGRPRKSA